MAGPEREPKRGRTRCCGDPHNLDGGAHPWIMTAEDDQGIHYACADGCGAQDTD